MRIDKEEVEVQRENESASQKTKSNNNKVYFFVIAIVALLGTNAYFYIKFKSSGEKLYTTTLQRENLQIQIDRIEAELDNVKNQGVEFTEDFQHAESNARIAIENLRNKLESHDLSEQDLVYAKEQVNILKERVADFKNEIVTLRIKNELLAEQSSKLDQELATTKEHVQTLEEDKAVLADKISKASSIKVSNVHINGVEVKRDGDVEVASRAKKVDNLQINFTIADNPVAKLGAKEVFVRVINPNGSLIANPEDIFYVHGEKLQYTFKEKINFTNNGEEYQFHWSDTEYKFKKGAYTVLLYADNAIMGRASILLK